MKDIKEITEKLEQGVKDIFNSDNYKEYLSFMSKFYNYSFNNTVLIFSQMPEATLVAGYKAWQDKFHRQVQKGAKAIKILAPIPHKFKREFEDENGNMTEKEINWTSFRAVNVFDISQTDGDEVPTFKVNELDGSVNGFSELMQKLVEISPCRIEYADISTGSKGYFRASEDVIVIKNGMTELQTVKTAVHEISHAMLHGEEGEQKTADRNTREVQAESIAYTVCEYLGLDTSDYSFGYITGWSTGKELKELTESMEVIRRTASEIIKKVA